MFKYLIIIIQEDIKSAANIAADKQDSGKTSKTFTVPLWPLTADTSKNVPSHRWCCWWVDPTKLGELMKDFHAETGIYKGKSRTFLLPEDGDPEKILGKVGLKTIESTIIKAIK